MRRIAVALSKGGTGKTTTAVNLAAALAMMGRRVLLVDCDTQGQCARSLGVAPEIGLAEVLLGEAQATQAIAQARDGLDLLAGGERLAAVKRELARREIASERALSEALAPIGGYDYVILDTAPGWDTLTINALFAVTEILAPIALEVLAIGGLIDFQQRIAKARRYHDALTWRYLVPTFYDRRVAKSDEILGQLREHYGPIILDPIRYNVRLSEAPGFGQTIFEYAPRSAGAEDYQRLAERIMTDD